NRHAQSLTSSPYTTLFRSGLPKVSTGTLRLGETTASYDAETPVEQRCPADHVTEADLEAVRTRFLGPIEQRPPVYSAVKVGGERDRKSTRLNSSHVKIA